MTITYLEHCTDCGCSALDDEQGRRPLPGAGSCGRCRCHRRLPSAVRASVQVDLVGLGLLRTLRRTRSERGLAHV